MTNLVNRYTQPGTWEVIIPFEKEGEEINFLAVIDARVSGEYKLKVIADHKVRGTKGRVTVRAVGGNGAQISLLGLIKIHPAAQETDDYLELRVLALDPTVRATAEPMLEIEANNVKASHGASVGQVDPEQILFLMSRGLSSDQAQNEIVSGWLGV